MLSSSIADCSLMLSSSIAGCSVILSSSIAGCSVILSSSIAGCFVLLSSFIAGCSVMLSSVLKLVPFAVLFGVFLYMGVSGMSGVQFFDRLILFFMPVKHHPQVETYNTASLVKLLH